VVCTGILLGHGVVARHCGRIRGGW
jgi:hypothetical protein